MSIIRYVLFMIPAGLLLSACVKEAFPGPKENPFVITSEATDNDATGVTLNGNITGMGTEEILEYGFVYNMENTPTISDVRVPMDTSARVGEYSRRITNGLEQGKLYIVRAYVKTAHFLVYGNSISFTSHGSLGPVIFSFSPAQGHAATRVVITGENFSPLPEKNLVMFGDKTAIVDSASLNRLAVHAPVMNDNIEVAVTVKAFGMETTAPGKFRYNFNWYEMTPFAAGEVYAATGFTIGDKGYLLGGFLYNPGIASNPRYTSQLWEYDMTGNTWRERKAMPNAENYHPLSFSHGNKGYTIIQNETKDMYEYDPATNDWAFVTSYPGQSESLVGFVIGDELYTGLGTDYNQYYNEFYKYSFASRTWTRLNDFPGLPRDASVTFTLNGKGYMTTGRNFEDNTYPVELWEYDPGPDQWTSKAAFPGTGRYMASAFTLSGKAYVGLGVQEDKAGFSDIWCYDAEKDSWERKDDYIGGGKWLNVVFSNGSRAFVGPGTSSQAYSSWTIWKGYSDIWEFVNN